MHQATLLLPLAFRYDEGALQRLEDLLTDCQALMAPGATLCCSLQTNTFMDFGSGYRKDWKKMVHKKQENLESKHFYLPSLDVNFRNSSLIFDASNDFKKDKKNMSTDSIQNVLGIPRTGTTLTQSPVHQLNFNWQSNHEKQTDLNDIMNHAISLFQKEVSSQDIPFVVLYDESDFKVKQVYDALKSCPQTGLNIFRYPVEGDPNPEKELDQFISQNNGCLLTSQLLFKGAEAENIFSLQISQSVSSNVRGTILRSVSRLYILNGMDEAETMTINNVKIDDSFLYCFEDCYYTLYECKTCNEKSDEKILVCFPCRRKCHANHEYEWRDIVGRNISEECVCKTCH